MADESLIDRSITVAALITSSWYYRALKKNVKKFAQFLHIPKSFLMLSPAYSIAAKGRLMPPLCYGT
ncbi:MAG TPA: hypothetical protein DDW84_06765 [Phycisphaerales bacterium]|nr:MAG: hypothetical protein A2Y13_08865 [Planctomycetes bacterium GWC2_45_44]HBG78526.1 hypothetical protein [Phycisphaerales bacterium]